ncbi:hypothetical protein EDB84DRAFT_1561601 [Lactarius hengduanensis]|nr:hypothetical protein EDB84DRAFT_1561601 [Lactarius hengduanensis]
MPRRTSVLERNEGYRLANYLRAIGDDPDTSRARESPVRERQVSQGLARRQDHNATPSQPSESLGGPTASTSAATNGPADSETHGDSQNDLDTGDFSGANQDTSGVEAEHQSHIQPEPLHVEEEDAEEDHTNVIHLPDLQTTQRFIQLLGAATLENSAMLPEDIESLRDPGPVDLEESSCYGFALDRPPITRQDPEEYRNTKKSLGYCRGGNPSYEARG